MRRISRPLCYLKKPQCLLYCLSLLLTLIFCYRSKDMFLRSYYFTESFLRNSSISSPPRQIGHTRVSSPGNSTCKTAQANANRTLCSGCARPRVSQIGYMLGEIGYQDNLIRDSPPDFFKPAPEVVQSLVTEYAIVPQLDCPYLLILQPSVLNRSNERDMVRKTWGSVAKEQKWPNRNINANVKIVFLVGNQAGNYSTEAIGRTNQLTSGGQFQDIKSEADLHNDILYLDMIDSYQNLTLKLLSAFKWVKDNCPCVQFVLKVDYDTFVNVPLLVDTLLSFQDRLEFSVLGMVYVSLSPVIRGDFWAVPESLYPMRYFPEYSSGCGYVLSYKAMSKIVDTIPYFRIFAVEDAFITGVMRRVIGCKMFTLPQMLTHYSDKTWHHCQMLDDMKMLGMSVSGEKHAVIWQSFLTGSCS